MAWFRREHTPLARADQESRVPEGLWVKCGKLQGDPLPQGRGQEPLGVPQVRLSLPHLRPERLEMLFDGPFETFDHDLVTADPLKFADTKAYATRLRDGKAKTNCPTR